jgi:hypothetical protein
MESASPLRQSIQAAAELAFVEPEKLSASCGVGGNWWAMIVDQLESKGRWGNVKLLATCVAATTGRNAKSPVYPAGKRSELNYHFLPARI